MFKSTIEPNISGCEERTKRTVTIINYVAFYHNKTLVTRLADHAFRI